MVPSHVNKHFSKVFEELCDTFLYWQSIDDQKGIMLSSKKAPRTGPFLKVYDDIRGETGQKLEQEVGNSDSK